MLVSDFVHVWIFEDQMTWHPRTSDKNSAVASHSHQVAQKRQEHAVVYLCRSSSCPIRRKKRYKKKTWSDTDQVCKVDSLTLLGHAHVQALLQPTRLAPVPGHLVDDAHLVPVARVRHVLLDAASEETLGVGVGGGTAEGYDRWEAGRRCFLSSAWAAELCVNIWRMAPSAANVQRAPGWWQLRNRRGYRSRQARLCACVCVLGLYIAKRLSSQGGGAKVVTSALAHYANVRLAEVVELFSDSSRPLL